VKIIKLVIENWCQYQGQHTFDFGQNEERNVVLIHADNDIGKSSLFNSIQWCLHEKQPLKWQQNNWPLYPIPAYQRANIKGDLITRVDLTFEHRGRIYSRLRRFETHKTSGGPVIINHQPSLLVREDSGNWRSIGEERLNRIFPPSVLGYFLFDAEKVEHFVSQSSDVRDSVRRLLDIEDADRAAGRLQTVATELRRQQRVTNDRDSIQLEQEITQLEASLASLRDRLDNPESGYKAELAVARDKRRSVEQELFTFRDAHALLEEQKSTEKAIEEASHEIVAILKKIRSITQHLYLPLLYPTARQMLGYLQEKRRKGELPKHVKSTFVDERIGIGKCVCGTELRKGTPAYTNILAFKNTLSDELSDLSIQLNNGLVAICVNAKSRREQLQDHLAELERRRGARITLEQRLKVIRSKIQARHDIPNVPQLQSIKEDLENREQELVKNISRLEAEIDATTKLLTDKNDQLQQIRKKQKHKDESVKKWLLAGTAQGALTKALDEFKRRARIYLEQQCNKIGQELFWREGVYALHIDDNYFIRVTSPQYGDKDLLAGMSMGVTQMAGLALICALARQTQAEA
jgi:DNA sulfur modification protein DndD